MSIFAISRIGETSSVFRAVSTITDDGVMSNNQGGVMLCSVSYFGLIQDGTFDFVFRLKSFLGTLASFILPVSFNFDEILVNRETLKYTAIPGNGGYPGIYAYLWLSYPGVIILPYLVSLIFKNRYRNEYMMVYFVMVMATFPRWYAYNMFVLIKMGFWLVIIYAFINLVHKHSGKYEN